MNYTKVTPYPIACHYSGYRVPYFHTFLLFTSRISAILFVDLLTEIPNV